MPVKSHVNYDFDGAIAVVTGGAKGIGLATVRRLLASHARVAVWDLDDAGLKALEAELGATFPGRLAVMVCDLCSTEAVQAAAAATAARFGPVSILVNNAALVYPESRFLDIPDAQWLRMYDVNVVGAHRCCAAIVPGMIAAGYGRVVNVGSAAGKNGNEQLAAYSASKAALINYTKTSAREAARTGVLINCVAPSATRTDGLATVSDEQLKLIESWIPMQRIADPAEIAALITWLCSNDCSFTTGATFDAAGGRTYY